MRNKCVWLAYVTGSVNQELLPQNENLAAENRILRPTSSNSRVALKPRSLKPRLRICVQRNS